MKHLLQIAMATMLIAGVVVSAGAKTSQGGFVMEKQKNITQDRLFSSNGIKGLIKGNNDNADKNASENNNSPNDTADQTKLELIHIYNTKQDGRTTMDTTEYLVGVLAAEMPASYSNHALMAQAVAARTYLYYKMLAGGCDKYGSNCAICTFSGHCQGYLSLQERKQRWGKDFDKYEQKLRDAVQTTQGQCMLYNGEIIKAMYHSSSAGSTEDYHGLYGGKSIEYLTSATTPDDKEDVKTQKIISIADFVKKMADYPNNGLDGVDLSKKIFISEYTDSGRAKTIKVGKYELSGAEFKNLFGLRSNDFTVSVTPLCVVINCYGHGHGIGMSQLGANVLALQGKSYNEILLHYYKGVEICQVSLPSEECYTQISTK